MPPNYELWMGGTLSSENFSNVTLRFGRLIGAVILLADDWKHRTWLGQIWPRVGQSNPTRHINRPKLGDSWVELG